MAYTARERVLDAIESIEERPGGLVAVIDVVDGVSPPLSLAATHRTLIKLAREGVVELRPESGVGTLGEREARRVPWVDLPRYGPTPITFLRRLRP